MLITKTNPVGIDKAIQQLQTKLHSYLVSTWSLVDADYHCHGRCYRNKLENGYVAEVFTEGKDYDEVYWNDNLKAISFFSVAEKTDNLKGEGRTQASVIFFVNVAKIKTSITHRADEEVRLDVINFFQGTSLIGYETGIDNVLREFPGSIKSERLQVVDMQPIHCFRINLNIIYQNC